MPTKSETRRAGASDAKKRRKSDDERKALLVQVRVTIEQRKLLADAAEKAGLDLSSWLRSIGMERARKDLGKE